MKTVWRRNKQL